MCFCVVETSSALNRKSSVILGNLWQFFGNFRKCPKTIVSPSDNFWRIFGILSKVLGNIWKTVQKVVISLFV